VGDAHMGHLRVAVILGLTVLALTGCDTERLNKLEKENAELKAKVEKFDSARDFDLQAKCSKDSRAWFNENYGRDKTTTLLDFSNHYNKSSNTCMISIEWHYTQGPSISWVNLRSLWNVYENAKYGDFSEHHYVDLKNPPSRDEVITCRVTDKQCKSVDEFNDLVQPYMNN
jgi:hypothetical protein